MDDIPQADHQITSFFNCAECVAEYKAGKFPGQSPSEIARFNVGYTRRGIQVVCTRHNINVAHLDLQRERPIIDGTSLGDFRENLDEVGANIDTLNRRAVIWHFIKSDMLPGVTRPLTALSIAGNLMLNFEDVKKDLTGMEHEGKITKSGGGWVANES